MNQRDVKATLFGFFTVTLAYLLAGCAVDEKTRLYTCEHPDFPDVSYSEACAASLEEAEEESGLTCHDTGYACRREDYP